MSTRQIAPRKRYADRLEFDKHVKMEMFRRAGGPENLRCEGCQMLLRGKPFEYDHTLECWEMEDVAHYLRPPLTAEDGKLLGKLCCHQPKTARKSKERAHGVRLVEKSAGIKRGDKRSSFRTNRDSRYKKRMDGKVVDRETGRVIG